MARPKPVPFRTNASIELGISRLDDRIAELKAFDIRTLHDGGSPQLTALEAAIKDTLERCFGVGTTVCDRFYSATCLEYESFSFNYEYGTPDCSEMVRKSVEQSIALLQEAQRVLKEDLADRKHASVPEASVVVENASRTLSNRIFVVHGHDEAALQGLARFLEKLGLEAIILKEQPDQGRTIIEKFEDTVEDIGFAVVLLTPDDLATSAKSETSGARARQNVIFELGYFSGKLGRGRVCLLRKGQVEIPSDLYGVIYTEMDSADGWKTKLVQELKAAKVEFDANRFWA